MERDVVRYFDHAVASFELRYGSCDRVTFMELIASCSPFGGGAGVLRHSGHGFFSSNFDATCVGDVVEAPASGSPSGKVDPIGGVQKDWDCGRSASVGRPSAVRLVELGTEDNAIKPGRWASSNRKKKLRKQQKQASVPVWRVNAKPVEAFPSGHCETVVSQSTCPSYGQALSDAEREAKESLARRRAAENAVAEKLAKMKLESLEDEQKCQEYAELKRQRIIQWTNEATAKSQQSLDKCKSIDPGSSSSQFEIRRQAKELADLKVEFLEQGKLLAERVPDYRKILADRKPITSSSMDRHELEAEFLNDNDSIDMGNSMFDAPFSRTRPFGQLSNDQFL